MSDDLDRILQVRVLADGLTTPGKNPWKCRSTGGVNTPVLVSSYLLETGDKFLTESGDLLLLES